MVIFFGPQASPQQLNCFMYHAWWGGVDILNEHGMVDLWAMNEMAVWRRYEEGRRVRVRVRKRLRGALEGRRRG
jgi:ABC-type ATPase with predicted acetyltransferase domain